MALQSDKPSATPRRSGVGRRLLAAGAVAAALAATAALASAPAGHYEFRNLGGDRGLHTLGVTTLAQDAAGFLWVGTEDGLFRYDGQAFQQIDAGGALPSGNVDALAPAGDGGIWVATTKGLVHWAEGARPLALLAGQEVVGVVEAPRGRLMAWTPTTLYAGSPSQLKPVAGLPSGTGGAWTSGDGRQLVVGRRGAVFERDSALRWTRHPLPTAYASETPQAIVRDARGRWWIRGRAMLLRFDRLDAPPRDLTAELPGAAVQKGELLRDGNDRIWAPTNKGIAYFDGDRVGRIDTASGLPNEWATTLLRDREGSLWVGSEGVQQVAGRLQWSGHTRREGLPSDTVWGVARDRRGVLWAATNRGVAWWDGQHWKQVPGTADRSVYAFAECASGDFWIGGNSGHEATNRLLHRKPAGAGFETVPLSSAPVGVTVNSLACTADGAVYVATLANGLHRVVATGGTFRSEAVALPGADMKEQVNQLALDSRGRLWAAGMRGLAVLEAGQWRRIGAAQGLLEGEVETVTASPDGAWVSYWNLKGISRVRLEGGRVAVSAAPVPASLVADMIYSAGFNGGDLWLGTAAGIKRWHRGAVERFGRADGLPGDDAAANGFWADSDGDVWFGLSNGLAHFDASQKALVAPVPPAVLRGVVDGLGRPVPAQRRDVRWEARALTFQFAALSYLDPAKLHRQVRLLGFENAWRDVTVGEARYTGLLPGTYTFQVRVRYGDGPFGAVAGREVRVLAPWWLSWWFLALAAVALVAAAALAMRWRVRRLRRRNAELEALVSARTGQLQAANEALEQASMVDPLTGLKNRRYLSFFMPEELARVRRQQCGAGPDDRSASPHNTDLCLLMVDLDHFKAVNDTYGHPAGDAVLRQLGEVLLRCFRESDVVVRWGGEEFLILARNVDRRRASQLGATVCQAIADTGFDLGDGLVLRKTCSVGVTAFPLLRTPEPGYGWEAALDIADQCLYAAKRSGRNGWVTCITAFPEEGPRPPRMPDVPGLVDAGWATLESSFGPVDQVVW